MGHIEKRIAALEAERSIDGPTLFAMLLKPAEPNFYASLAAIAAAPRDALEPEDRAIIERLEEIGNNGGGKWARLQSSLDRALADMLYLELLRPGRSLFELERLRGVVPDEILATVYNACRNHSGDSLRVRQLAGVVDQDGAPLPGYVLYDNGSILDADQPLEPERVVAGTLLPPRPRV